jgi:hypothetical protein
MKDLLAPHLLLFFIQYNIELRSILTMSFEEYASLRKSDGSDDIIPKLIDKYLEKMSILYPHRTRTTIFSNDIGGVLGYNSTRDMISKYTNLRFGKCWRKFYKDYQSEQPFKTLSGSRVASLTFASSPSSQSSR